MSPRWVESDVDLSAFMVSPDDLPMPEAPPAPQFETTPKAPELPEPPSPPEVKVESEVVPGWPKWLVDELEVKVASMAEVGKVDEEAPVQAGQFALDPGSDERQPPELQRVEDPIGACAAQKITRCPLLFALCVLTFFSLPIVVGVFGIPFLNISRLPLQIETTFDSFLQTDVPAAVGLASFKAALADRPASGRRLAGSGAMPPTGQPYSAVKDLVLIYELQDDFGLEGGLLSRNIISAISRFERKLRSLPKWQELCNRTEAGTNGLCEPGLSLASYVRATWQRNTDDDVEPQALRFDGGGQDPLNLPTALHFLDNHTLTYLLLPLDAGGHPSAVDIRFLRSAFRFKIYCCDQDSSSVAVRRDFNMRTTQEWEEFLQKEVIPLCKEGPGWGMRVYFDGTDVEILEVHMALLGDMWLALGSVASVFFYLLCHTRSLLLSLTGPLLSALALPLSFVVCGYIFGTTSVTFASALALFLTVGFGADVVLVYTDFWRASARPRARDADRLAWTYRHAGGASFATTATTALSFFANLASAIRALRQFAFLMGLCVVFAWILISLIYTPLCIVNERLRRRCCPGRGAKLASEANLNSLVLERMVSALYACRFCVMFLSLAFLGTFVGLGLHNFEMGPSLPRIFPLDHNRQHVEDLAANFLPLREAFPKEVQAPQLQEEICRKEAQVGAQVCHLHWCVATGPEGTAEGPSLLMPNGTDSGACSCWRRRLHQTTCLSSPSRGVLGVTRLVGVGELSDQQLAHVTEGRLAADPVLGVQSSPESVRRARLSPLLLQDWLSGSVELQPFSETTGFYQRSMAAACDWQDLCFCNDVSYVCELPDSSWTQVSSFQLPPRPSNASARRLVLVPPTVLDHQQVKVRVGFGMWITERSPLLGDQAPADSWGYVESFAPSDPWTQRTMFKFCSELPEALAVTRKWCWMEDFRAWLHRRGDRFPTREHDFDALALTFADSAGREYATRGRRYLWVEENRLRGFYFTFMVNIPVDVPTSRAHDAQSKWDAYVHHYRDLAAREGLGSLGIFHTSTLWAEAEAESELVRSTMVTVSIVLGLAFFGMLTFTRSFVLSLYVVLATTQVMAGLMFFITVVMRWQVGLIEVVAMIYFVGYAVTYPLHVAHKYADMEALQVRVETPFASEASHRRYQRTKWALRAIGGAAMGSAMTTACASLFLVFCTLTVFGKLGSMCLIVTVLSILTALGPLPAALLAFGPPRPGFCN